MFNINILPLGDIEYTACIFLYCLRGELMENQNKNITVYFIFLLNDIYNTIYSMDS